MGSEAFPSIGGYTVTARLGAGASGTVFLAEQQALSRQVALKVLSGAHASSLPRFHREAAAMALLTHPGLVRLYDHGVADGAPFIVMEYLPGGSLAGAIASGQARGVAAALRVARELFEVLGVMHDEGLLHRDIKPSNILLRESGATVLADLGLVRQDDPSLTRLTRDGVVVGTIAYLAPEVYRTNELTRATDLFAAGVVVYEVLTGRSARQLDQFSAHYRAPDPCAHAPDCPDGLRTVLMDLLASDPGARPETAQAVLRRIRDGRVRRVRSEETPVADRPRRAGPLAAGACALALALGAAARVAPWRAADPILRLAAAPTEVTVDLAPHDAELAVGVFDAAGRAVGHRIAPPGGVRSVVLGGLEPGVRHTVSVFRAGAAAEVLARRDVATTAQVRVIGLEPGATPALWMSANPTMTFSAGGASVELGPAPRAVLLRDARGPFAVTRPGQPPVALELKLPPPEPDRFTRLGLCVDARPDLMVREAGRDALPLAQWLARHDIRHVSLMPGEKGRPVLDPALLATFLRGGRVTLVARVHPSAAQEPGRSGWEHLLDDPALARIPAFSLGVRFDWLLESFGASAPARSRTGMTELQKRWAPYLTAHRPRWRLTRASQVRDMMSALTPRGPGFAPAEIEEINTPYDGDLLRPWLEWTTEAVATYRAGRTDAWVRAVTIDYERDDEVHETDGERPTLSVLRQFALVLRFFPGASVTYDLAPRLMRRDGRLRPVWAGLEAMAHRLAGLDAVSALSRDPALAPSLATDGRAFGAAFQAGGRGIQVFFLDARSADATFRPARTGLLATLVPPACLPGPARLIEAGRPVLLRLTAAPAIFEELVPVAASSADASRVAVTH